MPFPPAGSLVAADGAEAAAVAADNAAYAARIAARAAAGRAAAPGEAQTAEPLRKTAEAQAGGGACCDVGCQASAWGIADAYLALEQREEEEDADPLLGGSVLPTGGALATGKEGCFAYLVRVSDACLSAMSCRRQARNRLGCADQPRSVHPAPHRMRCAAQQGPLE
jgi:hypothetical protein